MNSKNSHITLKNIFAAGILLLGVLSGHAQDLSKTGKYFQSIRNNQAALTDFFRNFPKGGDLHHHFDGSVYAETYLEIAIEKDFWVNTETLDMDPSGTGKKAPWVSMKSYSTTWGFAELREKLMQRWSVRNFRPGFLTPEAHFFNAFMGFIPLMLADARKGMEEIKLRAIEERVQYIETIFLPLSHTVALPADHIRFNTELLEAQKNKNAAQVKTILDNYLKVLNPQKVRDSARLHNQMVEKLHEGIDTENFKMRYQNYVVRVFQPSVLFRDLSAAFISAQESPLIVGVNIVAPEDDPTTIRDYWLQMQMFAYLHNLYPQVKYAMHAGELSPGLVKPEEMSWHIRDAVQTAGALRIGHGTDLPWEKNASALLKEMKEKNIPVEINLSSNEFLIGVSHDAHPVMMYHKAGVPIVLSTDDAGVLRGSLTQEYILLAQRYPELSYDDIKEISRNAIRYAFIEEESLKLNLLKKLEEQFQEFELAY